MLSAMTLMLIGFAAGAVLGVLLGSSRFGCWSLLAVPLATYAYVDWWQGQNPELLRSTSGLAYLFVQPPPLIGALAGHALVAVVRARRHTR